MRKIGIARYVGYLFPVAVVAYLVPSGLVVLAFCLIWAVIVFAGAAR